MREIPLSRACLVGVTYSAVKSSDKFQKILLYLKGTSNEKSVILMGIIILKL